MLALTTTTVAVVILAVIVVGWIVYAILNIGSARAEVGSEIELAPNRKPYYDDETLEGRRLTMFQFFGVILLAITVIALPLYWVLEPNRQAGAVEGQENRFVGWGAALFATTADGGFNCAGCHGGMGATGGTAAYTITDPLTQEVRPVAWTAPALDTVFYRFSEDEVRFIIEYGRPGSPMSPWGLAGGGPMNEQQITTLLSYLKSIQIVPEDCAAEENPAIDLTITFGENDPVRPICESGHLPADIQAEIQQSAQDLVDAGTYATIGEALFNNPLAGGAYSCARCHTQGWSYGDPGVSGQGAFGWNLTGGATNAHFADEQEMIDFIANGSVYGERYGRQGQGSGRMPAFGQMLTDEQLAAIVEYVRSL